MYLQYLAEQKEFEKQQEKELDELVSMEVERQMKQRLDKWKKEREARKQLLNDVIETRRKQIKEKS